MRYRQPLVQPNAAVVKMTRQWPKTEFQTLLPQRRDALHNPCGLWQHGLGRSAALFSLPIVETIGFEKRLAAHPDPHHHSLAGVMQSIPPSMTVGLELMPRQATGLWLLPWRPQTWQVWLVAFVLAVSSLCSEAWDVERTLAVAAKLGPRALDGARALQSLQAELQVLDEPSKLRGVNEFFNRRVLFRDDVDIWGQTDYWASPLEMLDKGAGDCEDYAIAKYFSLLGLGVPVAKLRMVYVRAQLGGPGGPSQAHMVLAYYESANAEPLILDNLVSEVRAASRRPDLSPVFSFNSEGLWQGVSAQAASGDPVARLSRWRDVLAKARAEGFQ